jgi:hypothetical protein
MKPVEPVGLSRLGLTGLLETLSWRKHLLPALFHPVAPPNQEAWRRLTPVGRLHQRVNGTQTRLLWIFLRVKWSRMTFLVWLVLSLHAMLRNLLPIKRLKQPQNPHKLPPRPRHL